MSQARLSNISFGDRVLDRLKLQFLSVGNWNAELSDSGLPQEVQTVIRQVVSQTGLLRFEKAEIARELINHFLDGRDRDRTWESLVEDFGKIDVAVSLFRSSKLRGRPMSVKAFRGSFYALSLGLLGYLSLQLFFHSAVPEPSVDYGAMLNETVTSAPVEQHAWPHYRELYIKYNFSGNVDAFSDIYVKNDNWGLVRPSDQEWDKAVTKLESIKELLDAWRKFSDLPHLGTPLYLDLRDYSDADLKVLYPGLKREDINGPDINAFGLEPGLISDEANKLISGSALNILLPHIQNLREPVRWLHVDTRLAVTQGDQDRAVANIKAIHGLARQAADAPLLVCSMVGFAMHGIGFGVTEEVIVENPDFFDDNHLLELQQHVAGLVLPKPEKLAFEKGVAKDMIQRIYSDDGNGDGRLTAVGAELRNVLPELLYQKVAGEESSWYDTPFLRSVTDPISLFSAPSRKEMENMIDDSWEEWSKRMQLPMWEAEESSWKEYLDQKDDSGMLSMLLGAYRFQDVREFKLAYRDAVILAIACHRYRTGQQRVA